MKSSPQSYLLSLASALAGAVVGAMLVAIPFVMRHFQHADERLQFVLKWMVPFLCAFTLLYSLADWFWRKKYLSIRRWTRTVLQGIL